MGDESHNAGNSHPLIVVQDVSNTNEGNDGNQVDSLQRQESRMVQLQLNGKLKARDNMLNIGTGDLSPKSIKVKIK